MINDKLRRQITCEAARLLYVRQESEFHAAKLKAARRIVQGRIRYGELPTNREIREEIQVLARIHANGTVNGKGANSQLPNESNGKFAIGPADAVDAYSEPGTGPERFRLYQSLLAPLETVK